MFAHFEPGFGLGDGGTTIYVRRNGASGPVREMRLPPGSKISDLLEKAGKALGLDAPRRAFHANGVECTDMDNVEQHEVLHISVGEAFKASEGPKSGSQIVGNFMLQEKLGQGGFGSVFKGVHLETGETAAVKFVPKSSFQGFSDLQRVFQEIQALRNLRHPNVIRILDVAEHPDSICFIMEYAAGGELRAYVEKRSFLSEDEARHFFKQIVRAVHYMHSKKTIHRDLKLENILLDAGQRCKIVDFGLSGYVANCERTVTDAGTEAYLAPEVYNGSSGDADPYKLDVWALGVILFALAHGALPFRRPDAETCAKLDTDAFPLFKEEMTAGYRRLVKAQLTPRPHKRVPVDQIALDNWVTNNRFAICEVGSSPGEDSDDLAVYPSERQEADRQSLKSGGAGDVLDETLRSARTDTEGEVSPEPPKTPARRAPSLASSAQADGEAHCASAATSPQPQPPRTARASQVRLGEEAPRSRRRQGTAGDKALVAAGAHMIGTRSSTGGPLSRASAGLTPSNRTLQ